MPLLNSVADFPVGCTVKVSAIYYSYTVQGTIGKVVDYTETLAAMSATERRWVDRPTSDQVLVKVTSIPGVPDVELHREGTYFCLNVRHLTVISPAEPEFVGPLSPWEIWLRNFQPTIDRLHKRQQFYQEFKSQLPSWG